MVGRQVTADRPSPLSADEVRSQLRDGDDQPPDDTTPGSTIPGEAESSTTTLPEPGGGPTVTGDDGAPPPATDVTASPGTEPAAGGGTTTTAPPAPAPETRSYTLVGGSATLRFSSSGVTVVSATPNAGFAVETESTHDTGVRVRFRSDSHESEVEGWWENGPRDEVQEED